MSKVTVKNISDTKVELTFRLGAEELKSAEQVALQKMSRDLKIAGFRKGKAPLNVVRKNVNENALQEQILDNAISKAVAEGFLTKEIQALEQPAVEVKKFVPGSELEFTAEATIVPPVKLGNYKKLKSKPEKVSIKAGDVDEVIERMREHFVERKEVKRNAKDGDEVVIDFLGKKDGVAFEGGAAKEHALKLGSGQFIPGFEEKIIGHKAGEEFEIDLKFPKSYHAKELAGQKVIFEIKLHKVNELKLPELNDEFAAKCGPFTSMDDLKEDIKREITNQKKREATERFKDTIAEELADASKVALPQLLIDDQIKSIEQSVAQNLNYQGMKLEDYLKTQKFKDRDEWLEKEIQPLAKKRVKVGLVLAELSKELKIEVSHEELNEQINLLKQQYGKDEKIASQFNDPEVHRGIANRMITEKTIEKLIELNGKSND